MKERERGKESAVRKETVLLSSIVFDKSIYPRQRYWWKTAYMYSQAMRAGAVFPPVVVGNVRGKLLLVDGKHRIEALKLNKKTSVECYILNGLSKEDLYIQGVRLNIAHGAVLTPYDKARIINRLESMGIDKGSISGIVQVPMDKIKRFIGERATVNQVGRPQVLKSALKHLSEDLVPVSDMEQEHIHSGNEIGMVEELIAIFSNPDFPRTDRKFIRRLEKLQGLIEEYLWMNPIKKARGKPKRKVKGKGKR